MGSDGRDNVEEFYGSLMDVMRNADQSLEAMEVLIAIKGFERNIQQGYANELGIDEKQLDQILSKLIDATVEGGGEVSPETLNKTLETTEGYFGK